MRHNYEIFCRILVLQPSIPCSQYNFVLLICRFFVKHEELTSGSWDFTSLFCRRKECLQGSCHQLLVPRSLMWKSINLWLKKQASLSVPCNCPSSPSPLQLCCLVWNCKDGLWTLVHCHPRLPASGVKQPFLSTQHMRLQYGLSSSD